MAAVAPNPAPPNAMIPWWVASIFVPLVAAAVVAVLIGFCAHAASQLINDRTIESGMVAIVSSKDADAATRAYAQGELRALAVSNTQIVDGLLSFAATMLTAFFGIFGVGFAARSGFVSMGVQNQALQSNWSSTVQQLGQVNATLGQVRGLLDGLDTNPENRHQLLAKARGLVEASGVRSE